MPATCLEFSVKRTRTLENIQKLEQEAQAVSSVIENPDVAQALRQDKLQNLQYLKDTYGVRFFCIVASRPSLSRMTSPTAHA